MGLNWLALGEEECCFLRGFKARRCFNCYFGWVDGCSTGLAFSFEYTD